MSDRIQQNDVFGPARGSETAVSSHHEGGLVSAEVGGGAVLRHVVRLRLLDVLLLLLEPAGGDLKHQALQRGVKI